MSEAEIIAAHQDLLLRAYESSPARPAKQK
jgi:hypothetical protein